MAEPEVGERAAAGGKGLQEELTKKYGPFPLWVWLALGVGVVGGGIWLWRSQSSANTSTNDTGAPAGQGNASPFPSSGVIGGGTGGGGTTGGTGSSGGTGGNNGTGGTNPITPVSPTPPANPPVYAGAPGVAGGAYGAGGAQSFGPIGAPYVPPNSNGFIPGPPTGLNTSSGGGASNVYVGQAPGTTIGYDNPQTPIVYIGPQNPQSGTGNAVQPIRLPASGGSGSSGGVDLRNPNVGQPA